MSSTVRGLPEGLAARLRCRCGAGVRPAGEGLRCDDGHQMLLDRGYLDARPERVSPAAQATMESFGFEWTSFGSIQPEDEDYWQRYFADVDLADLSWRVGMDAGCGSGRYSFFTAQRLKELAAVDSSDAVEAAADG